MDIFSTEMADSNVIATENRVLGNKNWAITQSHADKKELSLSHSVAETELKEKTDSTEIQTCIR